MAKGKLGYSFDWVDTGGTAFTISSFFFFSVSFIRGNYRRWKEYLGDGTHGTD